MKLAATVLLVVASLPWNDSSKSIEGKIVTFSATSQIAIISPGSSVGTQVGMRFTVYRGDEFIATIVVKEVAKDWSAAVVESKYLEPQAGDLVSNQVLTPSRSGN